MLSVDFIYNVHSKDANTIMMRRGTNQKSGLNIHFFLEEYTLNAFIANVRNKKVYIKFKLILLTFKWFYCYLQDLHILAIQKKRWWGGDRPEGE